MVQIPENQCHRVNLVIIMSQKQPAPDSPLTLSKRAHKVLTLCNKTKVIESINGGISHHSVASKLGVGRTQINNIISNQINIQKMYSDGNNAHTKYLSHRQLQYLR